MGGSPQFDRNEDYPSETAPLSRLSIGKRTIIKLTLRLITSSAHYILVPSVLSHQRYLLFSSQWVLTSRYHCFSILKQCCRYIYILEKKRVRQDLSHHARLRNTNQAWSRRFHERTDLMVQLLDDIIFTNWKFGLPVTANKLRSHASIPCRK